MITPSQAARKAAIAFVRGLGPWKNSKINLPDDDYVVQAFARFEARIRTYERRVRKADTYHSLPLDELAKSESYHPGDDA